jgi:hypothetical protein
MQRWIVIGVLAGILVMGGGAFAWWHHRQNRPAPMWVQLPVRAEFPVEQRDRTIQELNTRLRDPELLQMVVRDVSLTEKWGLASEREAVQRLSGRVFVRMGEMQTPMGSVPAMHIGVSGKAKEREISGMIAERLMQDALEILGIPPPPKR